jgi:hypothetical protein
MHQRVHHVLVLGVGRHPLVEIESFGWEVVQRYLLTVATTSPSLSGPFLEVVLQPSRACGKSCKEKRF